MISVYPSNGLSSQYLEQETMRQNEKRCHEMLECKRQIDFLTAKLERLEEEHALQLKLARLSLSPTINVWMSLSPEDRTRKEFILIHMTSKGCIHEDLYNIPRGNLPRRIRADKDILLARVAREDFEPRYNEERLWVPPELRGDKEVILAILPKHSNVVESILQDLRDDDDIFLTMLTSRRLPNLALQHFSERIRSDKKLVLKLCAHIDGIQSLKFASSKLRDDKEFMMEAINASFSRKAHKEFHERREYLDECANRSTKYFHVLRYASQRLQDDEEIVLAAVAKSGKSLKYASYRLRRDLTVVIPAIENNGDAFQYVLPGETKEGILSDRNLVLNKIMKNGSSAITRRSCLDCYENDHEMILEALRGGVDRSSLPLDLLNSLVFAKKALLVDSRCYLQLPLTMRQEFEVAKAAIQGEWVDECVVLEAIEQCPGLLSDREFMLTIANLLQWLNVERETLGSAPHSIRADKEIMLQAVKNRFWTFKFCAEELKTDRGFLLEIITTASPLVEIPDSFQLENPDLIISGIQHCGMGDACVYAEFICDELWSNRDIAIAWVSQFGDWEYDFPEDFNVDEELCLILARENWKTFSFEFSTPLKEGKEFMLKAISMDARNIAALNNDEARHLRYDDDLTRLAFSKDKRAIQCYSDGEDFEYMVSFTNRVRKRIREYERFDQIVCQNILQSAQNNQDCPLLLLNQGPDVTRHHTNLIASYLGLPDKKELQMLLAASDNLLHWGF